MKYAGMPFGMWALFAGSFQKQLTTVLGYDADYRKSHTKIQNCVWDVRQFILLTNLVTD